MIPTFPEFKKLEITDKQEIEKTTRLFLPFSDYNFVSLWSWDTREKTKISKLNDNLVIQLQDYITNEVFCSFLGKNDIDDTITELIAHAKDLKLNPILHLIPESITRHIEQPKNFIIEEDADNFDYVLSVDELVELQGKNYRGKKNFVNRFKRLYGDLADARILNLNDQKTKDEIINLFYDWEKARGKTRAETSNELMAIKKLLEYSDLLDLQIIGVFIENQLKGFSINEITWDHYGIIHYEKADISYTGIFQYLKQQSAINFKKQGCAYINYEQDLGIEGLKQAKLAWHPVKFLKKYTIK